MVVKLILRKGNENNKEYLCDVKAIIKNGKM